MYESPIMILQDKLAKDMAKKIDEETGKAIYEATQRIGITVDDAELLKALRYDRGQYEKGYQDGKHEVLNNLQIYIQKFLSAYSTIDFSGVTE